MVDNNSGGETGTLAEAVQNAVSEWCAKNGRFPVAFICATDCIDDEGNVLMHVAEMDDQPAWRSLGLGTYLAEWYRDDVKRLWDEQWPAQDR